MRYHVRIEFREPSFELRTGPRAHPFQFVYEVSADNEAEAEEWALRDFRWMADLSSVSWGRDVVRVVVVPAPEEPSPTGETPRPDGRDESYGRRQDDRGDPGKPDGG